MDLQTSHLAKRFTRTAGVFTALCALFSHPSFASEESPPAEERIALGAIVGSCQNDDEAYRAIRARLKQLGATVEPPSIGIGSCTGPDCAASIKGQADYLMGGRIFPGESLLWLVDLARDQVLVQRHIGYAVNKPTSLARQAAALAERLHDSQAGWRPRAQLVTCSGPSEQRDYPAQMPAFAAEASDMRVALAVHAPRSIGKYAADFQKGVRRSLFEMGMQVREVRGVAPPQNPRDALPVGFKDLPLIDVQLLASEHDKRNPAPDGAVVRLSAEHRASQSSIDCAAQECEPAQLVQFVRRNAAALVDRSVEAEFDFHGTLGAAPLFCMPPDLCKKPLLVGQLDEATVNFTNAAGAPPPPPPVAVSTPSQSPDQSPVCGGGKRIESQTRRNAGIGLLIAGGLIGLASIIPAVLSNRNAMPAGRGTCTHRDGTPAELCYQTTNLWPVAGPGFALAALGLGSGAVLLALSKPTTNSTGAKASPCTP